MESSIRLCNWVQRAGKSRTTEKSDELAPSHLPPHGLELLVSLKRLLVSYLTGESNVRFGSCVDGSELARVFFTSAALVGAAMCSAC